MLVYSMEKEKRKDDMDNFEEIHLAIERRDLRMVLEWSSDDVIYVNICKPVDDEDRDE